MSTGRFKENSLKIQRMITIFRNLHFKWSRLCWYWWFKFHSGIASGIISNSRRFSKPPTKSNRFWLNKKNFHVKMNDLRKSCHLGFMTPHFHVKKKMTFEDASARKRIRSSPMFDVRAYSVARFTWILHQSIARERLCKVTFDSDFIGWRVWLQKWRHLSLISADLTSIYGGTIARIRLYSKELW